MNKTVEEVWQEVFEHWEKDPSALTEEEAENFMFWACEVGHKRDYNQALEFRNVEGPAWEELTEEQRQNIRDTNIAHGKAMNDLFK